LALSTVAGGYAWNDAVTYVQRVGWAVQLCELAFRVAYVFEAFPLAHTANARFAVNGLVKAGNACGFPRQIRRS
jgi:hypothetical protein